MIGLHGAMLCDLTDSHNSDIDIHVDIATDPNKSTNDHNNDNNNGDRDGHGNGNGDLDGSTNNDSILKNLLTSQSSSSDEIIQHATETAVVLIAGESNPCSGFFLSLFHYSSIPLLFFILIIYCHTNGNIFR